LEDTEKFTKHALPVTVGEGEAKSYRVAYAVHELLPTPGAEATDQDHIPTRFIGLISAKSLNTSSLTLRSDILPPATWEPGCLTVELGYSYLPSAWGKGYATSAVRALIDACKRGKSFWEPYDRVFVRSIVHCENPASQRVMVKSGMKKLGVHIWEGEKIFVAGKWRTRDELHIYGMFVVE
jgi:RimJ/RimL family protein N-acetyltransferase